MAILNYTTKIDHWKTINDVQIALSKRGVQKLVVDMQDNLPSGLSFCILWHDRPIAFAVPCNFRGILRVMQNSKRVPKSQCTMEQAMRVGWRIVKDWVEVQMAMVDAEVVTMAEAFMQYAITKDGSTVYQLFEKNKEMLALPPATN